MADAVVFVPGGYFLAPHAKHTHWFRHCSSVLVAAFLKKPVILYSCSIGPFVGKHNRLLAKYVLNKADIIVLREKLSRRYLEQIGVCRPMIYETVDAAFLLQASDGNRAEELFDRHVKAVKGLRVGVSVRPYDFPGENNANESQKHYMEVVAHLADYSVAQYGAAVFFMPQGLDGTYSDLSISRDIAKLMKNAENASVITEDYSPQDLKTLYGFMDVFVGVRMHANIFALGAKVPVLAIAYEPKTLGIMESLGLHEFVSDIRTLSFGELRDKMDTLIRNRSKIRDYLKSKIPAVQLEAQHASAITATFLEKRFRSGRVG
jgi:colanic acid/amylovoran biosynthesis protein